MGMFDWVSCEVELPDGYDPGARGFQTKDFENIMTNIKITTDGRLMMFFYDFEYAGDYNPGWTKCANDTDGDGDCPACAHGQPNPLCRSIPRFERTNERWAEYHEHDGSLFHGRFTFYDSDDQGKWHEYIAKFTDGQLEEIVLAPDRFAERQDQ